ncbi:probable E3 ubiquitin-protein ligase MID2 [Patiria miniata]|uniref:Uncharacterized protein n=1 Tax=Patiria miniata TaxID=46514 RepID=A0A913ZQZ1_PATMI|nr:probable E3 ubiquitin-protein ligase MID2 [Patiria miniata]
MAEAAAKYVLGTISRGHLECLICCCRFIDPKMMDCLHSFCLNCLEELISRQQPKADQITCPICKQETAVPDTGLQGLPNCFSLSSLVDEFNKQERLLEDEPSNAPPTCEECEEGLEAVSRCLDCDGNICQKCRDTHQKMKSTKKHLIVNLDQSEAQVPTVDLLKKDIPQCNKHTTNDLCFYCETCKTLACAACVALDHRGAKHKYREVADAIRSYRQDVGKIMQRFENNRHEYKVTDDSLSHARNRLKIMVARACKDITAKEEEEFAKIRNKSRLLRDKVTQIGEEREKKFEEVQKRNHDKMERAEQIVATVNKLMQQADDFELLDLKPKVMHNLECQEKLRLEHAQHGLSFVGVKCQDVVADADLGEVLEHEIWQSEEEFHCWDVPEFDQSDIDPSDFAISVACLGNGDIAVNDLLGQLVILTSTGWYKSKVNREKLNRPARVAASSDGLLLVVDEDYVKVFDSSLKFIRQFEPSRQINEVDGEPESNVSGIAVDKKHRIAVADRGRKLISLHHLDGSLITAIRHDLVDFGLAIGIEERLIFTNYRESKLICTTYTGEEVFNIKIYFSLDPVRPTGVCCDDAGDIYVSVHCEEPEHSRVFHYSAGGAFMGPVALGLHSPYDLTFTQRGDLVVADEISIKFFQRVSVEQSRKRIVHCSLYT